MRNDIWDDEIVAQVRVFLATFTAKHRHTRYLELAKGERGMKKLADEFWNIDFEWSKAIQVPSSQGKAWVKAYLRSHGAGDECVVWGHSYRFGKAVPLDETLEKLYATNGYVLICIPDKLAFCDVEGTNTRYILRV
jgi:hypothetical protein